MTLGRLKRLAGLAAVGAGLWGIARRLTDPAAPPAGSMSEELLRRRWYNIIHEDITLVDGTRPTAPNRHFRGSPHRRLRTAVWRPGKPSSSMPAGAAPPFPLVIYSHGFMSMRAEARRLARQLAGNGYVVLAAEYPLTALRSRGGPQMEDVVNQPGDVTFLIDAALAWNASLSHPLYGQIDRDRIAAAGLSLGGLTSVLAGVDRRYQDPRIKAVVSIAGPIWLLGPLELAGKIPPLLAVAGDIDALVDYRTHAAPVPERIPGARLITLVGAAHTSFSHVADGWLRWMSNPDSLLRPVLDRFPERVPDSLPYRRPKGEALPAAMHPGRQQMLTTLAAFSFLESHLSREFATRSSSAQFLDSDWQW